jgi:hypothetical protein
VLVSDGFRAWCRLDGGAALMGSGAVEATDLGNAIGLFEKG